MNSGPDIFDLPSLNNDSYAPRSPIFEDKEIDLKNIDYTQTPPAQPKDGFNRIEFCETPLEFEAFFDPAVNQKQIVLYEWQAETLSKLGLAKPTGMNPFKMALCTCNGSGKDAFIIAPFAVWFICCKIKSLVIITSSSGTQLTTQTEKYIVNLCKKVNEWSRLTLGKDFIKITRRRITCIESGSEIMLFATDDGAKAEGFHPTEPNAEFAIIVNEAKSVIPEIFKALKRCTGYNYWLNVSSPGEPRGNFYTSCTKWPNFKRVTYFDCFRHQSPVDFNEDKEEYGIHDPFFRSKWLAEFTFVGGKTVVNQTALERLRLKCKHNLIKHTLQGGKDRIGLDIALSGNGDETTTTRFNGNKQTNLVAFKQKDATLLAQNIDKIWSGWNISKEHEFIYADDGGVGRAVIDILVRMGWKNIHRVLNQSRAKKKKMFKNRGAELWYKFAKLIEHDSIILIDDKKLYEQISSRKFKESTEAGIDLLTLQSKRSVIAEGTDSPDRADCTVLALTDYSSDSLINEANKISKDYIKESDEEKLRRLTNEMRRTNMEEQKMKNDKKANFSLNVLLGKANKRNRMMSYERN